MGDETIENGGRIQKSLYADKELASWIEDVADKDDRSESYVLRGWINQIRDAADGEVIDWSQVEVEVKSDG